jgi:hypothetical protein
MKVLPLIVLVISLSFSAMADTVRLKTPTDFHVYGLTNTTFELNSETSSGDATTETAPARVYVPISNTNAAVFADHDLYFTLSGVNLYNTANAAHYIIFPLTLTLSGTTQYLYGAIYNGTAYQIVLKDTLQSASSSADLNYRISIKNICDINASLCTNLVVGSSLSTKTSAKAYFFISTDNNLPDGLTFTPSDSGKSGGVFFEINMSNRVYNVAGTGANSLIVSLTESRKGDHRAKLTYSSSATMLDFKKVAIFSHTGAPAAAPYLPFGNYTGSILTQDFPATNSAEITVINLINNQPYNLSVLFIDKFGFGTVLSDDAQVTPISVDELLKKQACYILTAGFGEEHYVTNYFRNYRDKILANSWFGRALIKVYYRTAPKYAMFIYRHEAIRSAVRGFAYTLYFLFNYGIFLLIFLGVFLTSCLYLNILRKNKIILRKDSL